MKYKYLIVLVAGLLAMGCNSNPNKTTTDSKKVNKTSGCVTSGDENICVLPQWIPLNHEDDYIWSYVIPKEPNTVFAVFKSNDDINGYLKKVYTQLTTSTTDVVQGYNMIKLTYADKETYFGKFYGMIGDKPYLTYSMIFKLDNTIYEIALKFKKEEWKKYSAIFEGILASYKHKGVVIFPKGEKPSSKTNIDLTKV